MRGKRQFTHSLLSARNCFQTPNLCVIVLKLWTLKSECILFVDFVVKCAFLPFWSCKNLLAPWQCGYTNGGNIRKQGPRHWQRCWYCSMAYGAPYRKSKWLAGLLDVIQKVDNQPVTCFIFKKYVAYQLGFGGNDNVQPFNYLEKSMAGGGMMDDDTLLEPPLGCFTSNLTRGFRLQIESKWCHRQHRQNRLRHLTRSRHTKKHLEDWWKK